MLTEEADSLSDCHTRTPGDWAGEPEAKAHYDHVLAVVDALSKLRAPVADDQGNTDDRMARQTPENHDGPDSSRIGVDGNNPGLRPIAARNLRSFITNVARFPNDSDRTAALTCLDVLLASAPVAGEAHPTRWLHTLHSEHDAPLVEKVTLSSGNPFGVPGTDYDRAYRVTSEPLYAAPQASEAVRPTDWQDALRVAELPEVDEALSNFANDCTQDNAVGLVQAILDAALKADKDGAQSTATRPESRASVESDGGALSAQPSGNPGELSAQPGAQKKCNCATCRPHSVEMRMILCEVCGDKRCPHAEDHRNACTAQHPDNKDGGAAYG
ncbi:hypothetical protein D3C86_1452330 [compost metagenome]